jgi:hypothetical protein
VAASATRPCRAASRGAVVASGAAVWYQARPLQPTAMGRGAAEQEETSLAARKGSAGDGDVLDGVDEAEVAELGADVDEVEDVFDEDLDEGAFAADDLEEDLDDGLGSAAGADDEDTETLEVPSPADPVDDEEAEESAALPATVTFDDDEDEIVAAVAGVDDEDDDDEVDGLRQGEFVCRSCYMAKLETQLADPEAMLCRDCA